MAAKTVCQIDLGCILLSINKGLSLSLLESSNVGLVDFTIQAVSRYNYVNTHSARIHNLVYLLVRVTLLKLE